MTSSWTLLIAICPVEAFPIDQIRGRTTMGRMNTAFVRLYYSDLYICNEQDGNPSNKIKYTLALVPYTTAPLPETKF